MTYSFSAMAQFWKYSANEIIMGYYYSSYSSYCTILIVMVSSILIRHIEAQANMCGMPEPDPMKTCVSVRLPWQPEPMHFCVEKEKFQYRSQCNGNRNMMHCGSEMRMDTLLVATPWDCCPLSSVPDNCMGMNCAPMPFNRTCKPLDLNHNNPWDCCQKYFCEENSTPENCHFKRLQPGCNSPPTDKMNCIGFHDPHGCCIKYQCHMEGKPGMCPMEVQAMRFYGRFQIPNSSMGMSPPAAANNEPDTGGAASEMAAATAAVEQETAAAPEAAEPQEAASSLSYAAVAPPPPVPLALRRTVAKGMQYGMAVMSYSGYDGGPVAQQIACVGDFNCPGTHKCCSSDMGVYSDGAYMPRSMHPTYGYCVEPVM